MIFAAGLGTRLKPWTEHHPKALVPVGGVPMLERVILKLKGAGITEMVVNVHHFADQIIDFLRERGNFGCDIHISDERGLLLDTGGGILAARRWLEPGGEPFVVHNADILTDFDLAGMIADHSQSTPAATLTETGRGRPSPQAVDATRTRPTIATLLVAPRDTSRYLLFDSEMRMRGWTNITTGQVRPATLSTNQELSKALENSRELSKALENSRELSTDLADPLRMLAFGGVHILSPEVFPALAAYREPGVPFSIMDFYIDSCSVLPIRGYLAPIPYLWHDIGKPASLAAANQAVAAI